MVINIVIVSIQIWLLEYRIIQLWIMQGQKANLEKIHIPAEIITLINFFIVFISFYCHLFIFVCMGFYSDIQIFASNWQLSHLVSGRRQVTLQCAFGKLSLVHSRLDRRKEEGRTDNAKTISISKSSAGDNKIWKSITRICVRRESLSVNKVYLKITKGHNSISSWCSATKPGVGRPHMQVHIPVKWQ